MNMYCFSRTKYALVHSVLSHVISLPNIPNLPLILVFVPCDSCLAIFALLLVTGDLMTLKFIVKYVALHSFGTDSVPFFF